MLHAMVLRTGIAAASLPALPAARAALNLNNLTGVGRAPSYWGGILDWGNTFVHVSCYLFHWDEAHFSGAVNDYSQFKI